MDTNIALIEEEKEFILCDNCIATCNTKSKLPMVMRYNFLTVLNIEGDGDVILSPGALLVSGVNCL